MTYPNADAASLANYFLASQRAQREPLYLLFGASDSGEGGAHDFQGLFTSREEAYEAALELGFVQEPRLSSWVHLAELHGQKMKVTHWLNIPDTEYDEHGELMWVAYE